MKQLVNEGVDVNIQDDNGVSAMRIYLDVFEQEFITEECVTPIWFLN